MRSYQPRTWVCFRPSLHPASRVGRRRRTLRGVGGGGQVMQPVCEWAGTHPGTRVLLLPSTRDAMAAPVFPTPPLARPGYAPSNVTMLPNPAVFTLDEVQIQCNCNACDSEAMTASTGFEWPGMRGIAFQHTQSRSVRRGSSDRTAFDAA